MASPEQSIKTRGLIFVILRAWRQVFLFAVLGAILLAGFAFYRGRTPVKPSKETLKLTDTEIEAVTQKALLGDPVIMERTSRKKALGIRSDYLSSRLANSVYLSINEKAQPLVAFEVHLFPEQPSPESEDTYEQRLYFLGLEYLKIAKGDLLVEHLADQCMRRVEGRWIMELLTFRLDAKGVLHFQATAPDSETARSLAGAAEEFFTDMIRVHLDVPYLFDLEIGKHSQSLVENLSIRDEREQTARDLEEVRLAFDLEQEAIDLRVEEVLDQALEEKIEQAGEEQKVMTRPALMRSMFKYGIAGAFIGLLFAAFIAVLRASSAAPVWSPRDYADQLELLYIGSIVLDSPQGKRGWGSGMDRWFERLLYHGKGAGSQEEGAAYLLSVIEGLIRQKGTGPDAEHVRTVAVMGDAQDAALAVLVDGVQELPSLRAVRVLADSAEGIKDLRSADAVVQLVQARRTSLGKAVHDLELARGMGLKILGVIGTESL